MGRPPIRQAAQPVRYCRHHAIHIRFDLFTRYAQYDDIALANISVPASITFRGVRDAVNFYCCIFLGTEEIANAVTNHFLPPDLKARLAPRQRPPKMLFPNGRLATHGGGTRFQDSAIVAFVHFAPPPTPPLKGRGSRKFTQPPTAAPPARVPHRSPQRPRASARFLRGVRLHQARGRRCGLRCRRSPWQ